MLQLRHEPEDPQERPCCCSVCREVPLPASVSQPGAAVLVSCFVGVYPRGLAAFALAELDRLSCTLLVHYARHCSIIFRPPLIASNASPLELTTFELLFELVGAEPVLLPSAPTLAVVAAAAETQVRAATSAWRRTMRRHASWRASVHRAGTSQKFKSPEVAVAVADALTHIGAMQLGKDCAAGPKVDLENFDLEVMAFISDGIDERRVINGESRKSLVGSDELLLLGVRHSAAACQLASLVVEKGIALSRGADTVAFCVAQRAVDLLPSCTGIGPDSGVVAADPMCGVGTYLQALGWLMQRRGSIEAIASATSLQLFGVDAEASSVAQAARNAANLELLPRELSRCAVSLPVFLPGTCLALPFRDLSMDFIVVDPPWGHRHGSQAYVQRYLLKWAREWTRVLRPGGFAIVVTICSKLFETQVIPQLRGQLVIEESVQFDNKGFAQCRLYTVRKPLVYDAIPVVSRQPDRKAALTADQRKAAMQATKAEPLAPSQARRPERKNAPDAAERKQAVQFAQQAAGEAATHVAERAADEADEQVEPVSSRISTSKPSVSCDALAVAAICVAAALTATLATRWR